MTASNQEDVVRGGWLLFECEYLVLHLNFIPDPCDGWHFDISKENLLEALGTSEKYGLLFQMFPWDFNEKPIHDLLST